MYINRQIFPVLLFQKDNRKITILTGARQVGKTTVLLELYNQLKNRNPCLFMDLDIFSNYERVSTYENLINTIKLNGYNTDSPQTFFLFLDEFQRYADLSRVLKNIADHHQNIKVYASGSSSLAINYRIQESLAGRKRILNLYPLNFSEFLLFRQKYDVMQKLAKISDIASRDLPKIIPEAYSELEQFLIFGGYPEVVLAHTNERQEVLASVFDLYVNKELIDYLNIDKIKNAKTLMQLLAVNNGAQANYSKIAQASGINEKTAKNYIAVLKETFIIFVQTPWFTNRKKEIVKQPKIYFLDSGVRNFFINNFNSLAIRNDAPFLFEGYVLSELIKKNVSPDSIKFWRTKNGHEVDMILDSGGVQTPVEIKYKSRLSAADMRGIQKYCSQYTTVKQSFLVNLADNTNMGHSRLLSPFEIEILTEI